MAKDTRPLSQKNASLLADSLAHQPLPIDPSVLMRLPHIHKKRPSVMLAWMNTRSAKPKGRGAAITRKWAVQLDVGNGFIHPQHLLWAHLLDRVPI